MKLADLIDFDFNLLGVFSRMGLRFGFGDETVEEACRKNSVDPDTFLLICGVYSIDGYMPSKESLKKADVNDIVKYLHQSHSYYMNVTMKTLADSIERMMEPCGEKHKAIIWKFFSEYKEELSKHFQYEEDVVFPYVGRVLNHTEEEGFTINQQAHPTLCRRCRRRGTVHRSGSLSAHAALVGQRPAAGLRKRNLQQRLYRRGAGL